MKWFIIFLATLISAELIIRLPLIATTQAFFKTVSKSADIITSNAISDHWKEIMLPRLAMRMIWQSLVAFMLLVVAVVPFLIVWLVSNSLSLDLLDDLLDPIVILFITAVAWIYLGVARHWLHARL